VWWRWAALVSRAICSAARCRKANSCNGCRPCRGLASLLHQHRLDIGELVDAVAGQLATEAGLLGATEWQAHIRAHQRIDEGGTGLQPTREGFSALAVLRPHAGAEAEAGVIGHT